MLLLINKKFKFHYHFLPVQNESLLLHFFIQNAQHLHSYHMLNMQYRAHSINIV